MKKIAKGVRLLTVILIPVISIVSLSSGQRYPKGSPLGGETLGPGEQDYPPPKPKYDYMSTFLSRNSKPLGFKEDLALKNLMRQPSIKWAIRAGARHVLD